MSDNASEVRDFVNARLKAQKLRAENKEQLKELKGALDETKMNLIEAMDAAQVSSVQSGIREWVVVYDNKKPKPLNVETLGSVLTSMRPGSRSRQPFHKAPRTRDEVACFLRRRRR